MSKSSIRHIFSIVAMIALLGYIAVAAVAFCPRPASIDCVGVDVRSLGRGNSLDDDGMITSILQRYNLNPVGKPMDEVSCAAIEDTLSHLSLVLRCECYKTIANKVCIDITCRTPILRVLTVEGQSYYVDREGVVVSRLPKAVYLPVATGVIDQAFATHELYEMAMFLQKNSFWDSQVEQINVTSDHEVELIPRVGNQVIRFGKVENMKEKFDKLKAFYDKGLSQVGWNRYSIIDISYGNQVVGVKKIVN